MKREYTVILKYFAFYIINNFFQSYIFDAFIYLLLDFIILLLSQKLIDYKKIIKVDKQFLQLSDLLLN